MDRSFTLNDQNSDKTPLQAEFVSWNLASAEPLKSEARTGAGAGSLTAERYLPPFTLVGVETRGQVRGARGGDEVGRPARNGDSDKVDIKSAIPDCMRYGAAYNAWDRLSPDEQKALATKVGSLTKEMLADSAAIKTSEATRNSCIIKKDADGRVVCLVDPAKNVRMHFKYDGDTNNVIAMVREDTKTKATTTYVAVQKSAEDSICGKREWITVNSSGRRSEVVGDVIVGKGGTRNIKLESRKSVEDLLEKKEAPPRPEKLTGLAADKKALQEAAEKAFADPAQRRAYMADIEKFQIAGKERGLSEKEISQFFKESTRLLSSNTDTFVKAEERAKLAAQALKQAVEPTSIKQGPFKTCNVTSVEVSMYTRQPSAAMKAITEAALTGKFTTADGKSIELPPSTFVPKAGARTFASQIFQDLAVNTFWNDTKLVKDQKPYTDVRYRHDGAPVTKTDTGQRVTGVDETGVVKELYKSPGLATTYLPEVYRRIAGNRPDVVALSATEGPAAPGALKVESAEKLHEKLAELSRKPGGLPVIIMVHTSNEPFWKDSGRGSAAGAGIKADEAKKLKEMPGGWHVVTITGYDPRTKMVALDNTWDDASDHLGKPGRGEKLSVDTVFNSMRTHAARLKELGYEAPPKKK